MMFEFIEALAKTIENYKSNDNYASIFNEISDLYYRECYHSDIIAFYLKNKIARREFINHLNKLLPQNKSEEIVYDDYSDCEIKRESDRIDIVIYNNCKTRAIIVENKSNDAKDQWCQVHRYFKKLWSRGIEVDCLYYLNKNSNKPPDLTGLSDNDRNKIENKIVVGQLVGHNSFVNSVINHVLMNTNDIRLNALSQEIKELFNSVVYGEVNMENMDEFVKELQVGENHEKLKKIIKAYNDMPSHLAHRYKQLCEKSFNPEVCKLHFKIWKNQCLVIDNIKINNKIFAIDLWFNKENVDISLTVRNGNKQDIGDLKEYLGNKFPFDGEMQDGRYRIFFNDILDKAKMIGRIKDILQKFQPDSDSV